MVNSFSGVVMGLFGRRSLWIGHFTKPKTKWPTVLGTHRCRHWCEVLLKLERRVSSHRRFPWFIQRALEPLVVTTRRPRIAQHAIFGLIEDVATGVFPLRYDRSAALPSKSSAGSGKENECRGSFHRFRIKTHPFGNKLKTDFLYSSVNLLYTIGIITKKTREKLIEVDEGGKGTERKIWGREGERGKLIANRQITVNNFQHFFHK